TRAGERKLQNRYLLRREKLLTFLYYPGVPPTNNQSEQALRTSVIHRKVTNGFRSDWVANAYADLLSVVATSKIKGQRVFETLVNLTANPAAATKYFVDLKGDEVIETGFRQDFRQYIIII